MAALYTHVRITTEYRDKLKKLAEANKQSMAKELEVLIDLEEALRKIPTIAFKNGDVIRYERTIRIA